MQVLSNELEAITWSETSRHLLRLIVAYLLALPTALNRERHSRGAGLRTFPLVAVGVCAYMLVGREVLDTTDAHSRVIYGIITGIGFIGGGTILKSGTDVHGTATAAGIWTIGAMGVAVAWQRYDIAIALSLVSFLTLSWFAPLKEIVGKHPESPKSDKSEPDRQARSERDARKLD